MFVSVCDRPSVAEPTETQDCAVMESSSATIHRKMPIPARQLPITESAHKARVVGDARRAAIVAGLDVTAKRRRSARRDRAHDAPLGPPHMSGVIAKIGLAMATQDIRNLNRWSAERSAGAGHGRRRAPVYSGGTTAKDRRSSGLGVARIVWAATCV
jgi:hypothetical protein